MEVMDELHNKYPELKDISAVQLLRALHGAGVDKANIEAAVKKLAKYSKKNKRVSRSIKTIIKFD